MPSQISVLLELSLAVWLSTPSPRPPPHLERTPITLVSSPTPSVKTSFHQAHIPRSFGGCDLELLRVSCQQETGSELVALLTALCSSPPHVTLFLVMALHEEVLSGCSLTGL